MGAVALPSLSPGTVIAGRYAITARLGAGGMGDVYEVEHQLLGRRFALKRLHPELAVDRAMVERFLREARAAAQTGHPSIVEVVDLGFSAEGWPFLVMERLAGETLRERLRRGPVDAHFVAHMAASVLDALAAVHDRGIIHRDIKPENLFVCAGDPLRPRIKVLDFGIAHLAGDHPDVRLTHTGAVMGTPAYMSPEQARGHDVDARTDLYSLGVVLYECVAGRPPFTAEVYSVLVARILEDAPELEVLAAASGPVQRAIATALAKRREERFATAGAMRAALAAPPVATPAGLPWAQTGMVATVPEPEAETVAETETVAVTVPVAETVPVMVPGAVAVTVPGAVPVTVAGAVAATATPAAAPAGRRRRWLLAAAAAALVAVAALVALRAGTDAPATALVAAPAPAGWELDVARGDLAAAAATLQRAVRRRPDDLALASRDLLVALVEDRTRAYARLDVLDGRTLPPLGAAALVATRAMRRGVPLEGAAALAELAAAADPTSAEGLLLHFARAELLRQGDRWDQARVEYTAILERHPAFAPAVDGLLQRLLFLDEIAEARRVVERFVAHAPDGAALDMIEIELAIGERRYREALDRVERLIASNPGRVAETYQYRGDLRLLLGDVDGAIAAYDAIEEQPKRDEYVAGALLHAGRVGEARERLAAAIGQYPRDAKPSRLGKLVVDASLLALETGDRDLAEMAAGALAGRGSLEAPVQGAAAYARAVALLLAGGRPVADELPLGAASPLWAHLAAHGQSGPDALARLRAATEPDAMHFGVVVSHIYGPLWLERARVAAALGHDDEALAWTERVVRPRHYDASRGVVIGRALTLRADVLERLGRGGEAAAVRRELSALRTAGDPRRRSEATP